MAVIEESSTITVRGQTTVPKSIRRALGLEPGSRISFRLDGAHVSVHRDDTADDDPALGSFLDFLEQDITRRPDRITSPSPALLAQMTALTQDMDVDLAEEIVGETSL